LKIILKILILAVIGFFIFSLKEADARRYSMDEGVNRLLVVYDNNTLFENLTPAYGFSCLLMIDQYHILFDTGGNPTVLMENINRMDIDPEAIDSVVLSHIHGDHTGGLSGLLQKNKNITVYMPKSFPRGYKNDLRSLGTMVKEVEEPMMIHPSVYTTGELGTGIKEQSIIVKTRKGLVIITGCAHPGILKIVEMAKNFLMDRVHLVLGGFHLMGSRAAEIRAIINRLDELGVKSIAPCHCSGDTARELFRQHYGDNYIECGVGLVIEIPDIKK